MHDKVNLQYRANDMSFKQMTCMYILIQHFEDY